jgi:hypothetical protein
VDLAAAVATSVAAHAAVVAATVVAAHEAVAAATVAAVAATAAVAAVAAIAVAVAVTVVAVVDKVKTDSGIRLRMAAILKKHEKTYYLIRTSS